MLLGKSSFMAHALQGRRTGRIMVITEAGRGDHGDEGAERMVVIGG